MLSIQRKYIALLITGLLVSVSLSSAWAVTRTLYSNKDVISGGTYYYNGNYDFINNSHFNLSNKIYNSKGNIWNASAKNLQFAIWDLNDTDKGKITIPDTTITITATIQINNQIILEGTGNTILSLSAGINDDLLSVTTNNITIRGIQFDGNRELQTDNYTGIGIGDVKNVLVENCRFVDFYYSGIVIWRNGMNCIISNCWFENCSTNKTYGGGILIAGSNNVVTSCTFINCNTCGVVVEGNTTIKAKYNRITNCYFSGNISHGVHLENGDNCTVSSNIFKNLYGKKYGASTATGIYCAASNTAITGNVINTTNYEGITATNLGRFCTITSNIISTTGSYGIYSVTSYSTVSSNHIYMSGADGIRADLASFNYVYLPTNTGVVAQVATGNYVYNAGSYGISVFTSPGSITGNYIYHTGSYGIYVGSRKNVTVSGNVIGDGQTAGIGLESASNCSVVGNRCFDDRAVKLQTYGVREFGTSNYNLIMDNEVYGNNVAGLAIIGASTIYRDNSGYRTENWGNTSVANNGTISHGLATTPTVVILTSNYVNLSFMCMKKSSTTFTVIIRDINTHTTPSGSYYVMWYAKV